MTMLGLLAVGLLLIASACGGGSSKLEVTDAVMPVPGSADETSVYMTLTNNTDQDDELLNADTDIAPMTHLHQTRIADNGRASMSDTTVVKVGASTTVRFTPGGRHLMLMHPKDLKPGDTFTMYLNFRRAGTVAVTVKVIDIDDLTL